MTLNQSASYDDLMTARYLEQEFDHDDFDPLADSPDDIEESSSDSPISTPQLSRERRGYLHDGSMDVGNVNTSHYRRALNGRDIEDEEYWYQSVFHKPEHAKNLKNEVNQSRRSNNIKIYGEINNVVLTDSEEIKQSVKLSEVLGSSTMVANPAYSVVADTTQIGFLYFLNDITQGLTVQETTVLAYYLAKTGLDTLITEEYESQIDPKLMEKIYEVWSFREYGSSTFYSMLKTRYQAECAKWKLTEKLKHKFKSLMIAEAS